MRRGISEVVLVRNIPWVVNSWGGEHDRLCVPPKQRVPSQYSVRPSVVWNSGFGWKAVIMYLGASFNRGEGDKGKEREL